MFLFQRLFELQDVLRDDLVARSWSLLISRCQEEYLLERGPDDAARGKKVMAHVTTYVRVFPPHVRESGCGV